MYGPDQQQNSSPDYDTEANTAMIVDEAEKLYNKLVRDCLNKIITDSAFSTSLSSLPMLPQSNEEQKSFEVNSNRRNQTHMKKKNEKGNKDEDEEAVVTVRDTGIGIDSEILPRLLKGLLQNLFKELALVCSYLRTLLKLMAVRYGLRTILMVKEAAFYFSLP